MTVETLGRRAVRAGRNNHFHLIRLVLASLVIVAHSPELIDGDRSREVLTQIFGTLSCGELAVDGFFLVSGYLITQSWYACPSALAYLRNRVLRIYPGFVVASLLCIFVVGPLATGSSARAVDMSWWAVLRDLLVLRPPVAPGAFAGTPYPVVNGSLWTIALEFGCYMGVLGLGLSGLLQRRRVLVGLALALFALYVLQRCVHVDVPGYWKVQGAIRVGFCFAVGALFYTYRAALPYERRLALGALAGLLAGLTWAPGVELAVALCGGYLLFFVAFMRAPARAGAAAARGWPDISYGVYLYGWPVQKLLILWFAGITPGVLIAASLAGSLVLGFLSWHLVEKPFISLKSRAARGALPAPRDAAVIDTATSK
ncbi:acyltransferase family protein [Zemynaea arenosa]|nr:acyltransferase [Massilia arenosa]